MEPGAWADGVVAADEALSADGVGLAFGRSSLVVAAEVAECSVGAVVVAATGMGGSTPGSVRPNVISATPTAHNPAVAAMARITVDRDFVADVCD